MVLRSFILVTVLATLAVAGPLLGGCGGAPQNEQNTILSVCEVMRSLDKFEGKLVLVRGIWKAGMEFNVLQAFDCHIDQKDNDFGLMNELWLEPPSAAVPQSAGLSVDRQAMKILSDRARELRPSPGETVVVTFKGRIDSTQPQFYRKRGFRRSIGYGHLGGWRAQLIYVSGCDPTVVKIGGSGTPPAPR